MTALKRYQRLEASGVWRAEDDAPSREVIVSFGKATLVMTDADGNPLTHWSLAAVHRKNSGTRPAIFYPSTDTTETLEIEDAEMIDAIEEVRRSLERAKPKPGRLRGVVQFGALAAVLGIAAAFGPTMLERQTLSVVPVVKRSEIGATVLGHLQARLGPACRDANGIAALEQLRQRLFGAGGQIVVLREGLGAPVALPGNIVVIDRTMIDGHDDPHITAGHILAARNQVRSMDPLAPILRNSGMLATAQLLTTGELPGDAMSAYADALLDDDRAYPVIDDIEAQFADVGIQGDAFLATRGVVRTSNIALSDAMPVLTDRDWVALQGICFD